MGLDITAYARVKLVQACTVGEANNGARRLDEYRHDVVLLYTVMADRADGLVEGFYEYTGDVHHFRAGSYSGYNRWREMLAALVGVTPEQVWKDPRPGPFVELINYSDCEGFIGPETSAKLAADFKEWAERAGAQGASPDGDWFVARYNDWRRAFEIASRGGVVKFH